MDSSQFSFLNLEFIFVGDRQDAAQVVQTALADRRLLGFVGGAEEREHATEVGAQIATVSEARDAVLYRVDAKGKLREGSRVTRLVHELKNSTGADYVLVDGEEIDGPVPDEQLLGDYGTSNELLHGPTLKGSELVAASGLSENHFAFWDHGTGLMAMPAVPLLTETLSRSSRPFLSLVRSGNTISALIEGRSGALLGEANSLAYFVDLERTAILEPEADSPAAERLAELDRALSGWDEADLQLIDELISDPAGRSEARQLLQQPGNLKNLKRFVGLFGFDPRSVDYVMGRPLPDDARLVSTGGPLKSIRAMLAEHEAEVSGPLKLLYRAQWSPKALIASSVGVLASGVLTHVVLAKSRCFAWVPKPLRTLLMLAWYADGVFYLGKGVLDAVRARKQA